MKRKKLPKLRKKHTKELVIMSKNTTFAKKSENYGKER